MDIVSSQSISELMNENVANLAAGVFKYERPRLLIQASRLEIDARPGTEVAGTFSFDVTKGQLANGYIFATSVRMRLDISEFSGSSITVKYYFDGTGMEEGDIVKGDVCIISDCGEYAIPFVASRKRNSIISSTGMIKNLFHFTNLAQENFEEACKVFYSDEFENIFINHDRAYLDLYRGFRATYSKGNVEEFLVAIKKKLPISYSVEGDISGKVITKDEMIALRVNKSGWGYVDLSVSSDNEAITLDKDKLESVDFNPYAAILLTIDYNKLHNGKNFVRINLEFPSGKSSYEFYLYKNPVSAENHSGFVKFQKYKTQIVNTYIDFRIHNITKAEWQRLTMQLTERVLIQSGDDVDAILFRAHMLILQGRVNEGNSLINKIPGSLTPTQIGYKRYLGCLCSDDAIDIKETARFIADLYRKERTSGLLWLLLFVDEDIKKSPEDALSLIANHAKIHSLGPLLLLEAYHLLAKNPQLIEGESKMELLVLNFAAKTGLYKEDVIRSLLSVFDKTKGYVPLLHNVLVAFYEEFKTDDLLATICTHLIRGQKTDEKYNKYYLAAIERNLKITRLYEYYMFSLPNDFKGVLPKSVRLYYSYGNELPGKRKALLYSNLISHKDEFLDEYRLFGEEMQLFCIDSINSGEIDVEIANIIKEFRRSYIVLKTVGENAEKILFTHRVNVLKEGFRYLCVVENPLVEEKRYLIKEGQVFANIFSKEYSLFLEMPSGKRVAANGLIEDIALFNPSDFSDILYECDKPDVLLSIVVCEMDGRGVHIDDRNERFVRTILDSELICESYKREYRRELLQFYYDSDQIEKLDAYLLSINPKTITPYDRDALVEFLVRRDMQEAAFGIVSVYGGENIDSRLMVKLCSKVINSIEDEKDDVVLYLAHLAFEAGKYDTTTLSYLTQHYSGMARSLRDLHRAALNFDLETVFLEERIIKQMLFTGSFVAGREEIIEHYYRYFPFSTLSLACISYDCWEYFAHDALPGEKLFDRVINTAREGNKLNEICSLSAIRYFADHYGIRVTPPEVYSYIRKHISQGIFFPFFLEFKDEVEELKPYENRTFIEYRANPSLKVMLHYLLETGVDDNEYDKTEMVDLRGGIRVKNFLMFYGESLQYYITEELKNRENLTESDEIAKTEIMTTSHESRYDVLNDMLVSYNLKDDKSLIAMMDLYQKKDYITKKMFTIKGE